MLILEKMDHQQFPTVGGFMQKHYIIYLQILRLLLMLLQILQFLLIFNLKEILIYLSTSISIGSIIAKNYGSSTGIWTNS